MLRGKVLLPVLGDEIERCLASRQIQIRRRRAEIHVAYFEHEFPISARSLLELLQAANRASANRSLARFAEMLAADFSQSGGASSCEPPPDERTRTHWIAMDDAAAAALDASITAINAEPALLKRILDLQYYRLAFWRRANQELNYRRFFDIHQLAGVCVEKEEVFAATHEMVLGWVNEGRIAGLRIDHPDGLRDPTSYLERLRAAAPQAWVVVEKILEPGETLAPAWPVAGTTGYDFLNLVSGLFVDPWSERLLTDFYGGFTNQSTDYADVVHSKKRLVLERLFSSELSHLVDLLEDSRRRYAGLAGLGREEARRALAELIASFPVYRTYIRPDTCGVGARDQAVVREALTTAMHRQPDIGPDAWHLIEDLLMVKQAGQTESEFVWRFQQLTGPVMAKGAEDTSFTASTGWSP